MTYNELNFPDLEHSLSLWPDVCRKMKPEDDWGMWCATINDEPAWLVDKEIAEMMVTDLEYNRIDKFYAIPCPSLGEMIERLALKDIYIEPFIDYYPVHLPPKLRYRCLKHLPTQEISRYFIKDTESDTAPNAAAKGLIEMDG